MTLLYIIALVMIKLFFICSLMLLSVSITYGQKVQYADLNVGIGQYQGSVALGYFYDWQLGKNKKIEVGLGVRFTSYLGADKNYITAPAKLTSGRTDPTALFVENIEVNIDTFIIKYPQVNSLNLLIDLGYKINPKWKIGFNIDFIGVSFGSRKRGNFVSLSSATGKMETARPSSFNLLLISDNDLGSLNSEFYGKYFYNSTWAVKTGFQFLFTEYTTRTPVQQVPELNDRFRLKSLLFSVGISKRLNN